MSGRDKDKGKAHGVDHGKSKKNKNRRIDVSSDTTRQWVRPTGITFCHIDEQIGTPIPTTPIPTATTPPPYSTPFPTIPSTPSPPNPPAPSPPILPASFPAATTSQATTSQPPHILFLVLPWLDLLCHPHTRQVTTPPRIMSDKALTHPFHHHHQRN